MEMKNQKEFFDSLKETSFDRCQSIIIEGPEGCGKTYCAKRLSDMLGVETFAVVNAKMDDIRDFTRSTASGSSSVCVCIENLDEGVAGCSYAILKSLEDIKQKIYMIVTCSSIKRIPDTIVSRCIVFSISSPRKEDIENYCKENYKDSLNQYNLEIVKGLNSFNDVNTIMLLSEDKCKYIAELPENIDFKDTVSSMLWKICHYEDNSETPIKLVMKHMIAKSKTPYIRKAGITCYNSLCRGNISNFATISRYLFDCKYCE